MFGLYRRACGGEIVKSFYDFDTQSIGPYVLPVDLYYNVQASQVNQIYEYIFYNVINSSSDILAVFNLNNSCIACVTERILRELDVNGLPDLKLPAIAFTTPIKVPSLEPIGYWKTYQENLTVTQLPYKMFRDKGTNLIDGTDIQCPTSFLKDPPLPIYKTLVGTDNNVVGVLWDYEKVAPIFVKVRFKGDSKEFYIE